MCDTGFIGDGPIVCPFKSGEGGWFQYRTEWNKDIRTQRILNEWAVGWVNNRYRIFLGRWPYELHLHNFSYENVVMISNLFWRRHRNRLYPNDRRVERIQERPFLHEA